MRESRVTGSLAGRAVCLAVLGGALLILTGCAPPLPIFTAQGNTKEVQHLLDQGMSPNFRDETFPHATALQWAVLQGRTEVARLLLDRGADVNAVNDLGGTALQIAAWHGHAEIVRLLLERGADINRQSNTGWTALHAAARQGHEEVVRILLQQGADRNLVTQDGQTPATVATHQGHAELSAILQAGSSGSEPAKAPIPAPTPTMQPAIVPPPIY